jgi:hypothetical protein
VAPPPIDFQLAQTVLAETHKGFQVVAWLNSRGGLSVDVRNADRQVVWAGHNILEARAFIDSLTRPKITVADRLLEPGESAVILALLTAEGESFDQARAMIAEARAHVLTSEEAAAKAACYEFVWENSLGGQP